MLGELGAFVVSADELVHQLLASDRECIHKIELLFGPEVKIHHKIDRKKLAKVAFADPKKLGHLETIVHPLVFQEIKALYKKAGSLQKYRLFVVEVPLLFEAGWESLFDEVVAVAADASLCLKRSGLTPTEYALRVRRFLPVDEKIRRADYVILNNTTEEDLRKQVTEIVNKIENLS